MLRRLCSFRAPLLLPRNAGPTSVQFLIRSPTNLGSRALLHSSRCFNQAAAEAQKEPESNDAPSQYNRPNDRGDAAGRGEDSGGRGNFGGRGDFERRGGGGRGGDFDRRGGREFGGGRGEFDGGRGGFDRRGSGRGGGDFDRRGGGRDFDRRGGGRGDFDRQGGGRGDFDRRGGGRGDFDKPSDFMRRSPRDFDSGRGEGTRDAKGRRIMDIEDDDAAGVNLEEENLVEADESAVLDTVSAEHTSNPGYVPVPFSRLTSVRKEILDSIKRLFRFTHMSEVQNTILSKMPFGNDLLIKSKTGTGKTLAFLIPALQRSIDWIEAHPDRAKEGRIIGRQIGRTNCTTLIITPTRELAQQVAGDARRLMYYFNGMKAHVLVGGEPYSKQQRRLEEERVDMMVATPGRLLDMLRRPEFSELLKNVQTLILDEADLLLDMGFKGDVERVAEHLPKERQTYLLSATISESVKQIAKHTLRPGYDYVNTVPEGETNVHSQVTQEVVVLPDIQHQLVAILKELNAEFNKNTMAKVIVFFPTTVMTQIYSRAFKVLRRSYPASNIQQFEIHAGRDQERRFKTSAAFRRANSGAVLFTTDVSARGVDYPGVTLVIQVGPASNRELYIHRVGRTGRAGQDGRGVLILNEFERAYLEKALYDIPLTERVLPENYFEPKKHEASALAVVKEYGTEDDIETATRASFGFYGPLIKQGHLGRTPLPSIVDNLKRWGENFGLKKDIVLSDQFLSRAGLLRASRFQQRGGDRGGDRRGGFGRGSFSGGRNDYGSRDTFSRGSDQFSGRGPSGGRDGGRPSFGGARREPSWGGRGQQRTRERSFGGDN